MQTLLGVLVGLFTLSFLVAIHEYGHALFAYLNKVIVEIFAIGFPPKIWSKKLKNKTEFVINALPIGGYVKLKGEWDAANKKGDYGNVNFWAKNIYYGDAAGSWRDVNGWYDPIGDRAMYGVIDKNNKNWK